MDEKYVRNEKKEIFFYVFLIIFFGLIISISFGFAGRGFEESITSGIIHISAYLGTFIIYIPLLIISIALIMFPLASLSYID